MNDIRKCQQFSRKQREEFFSEINDDVTRTCRTSLGVLSIVRARFHERTPSTRVMRPSTDIDILECFLLRSINPRTGGASGMMGIRTSRSGRDRPLLDWTESDTKIARSSFHCRSTSSVPLGPRRERPWNYSGDTPGHPDQPIANAAPAPKSRPGALCYNNTFSLCLSTNNRGEPQICRSGHWHDGSVSVPLSRARRPLLCALHPSSPRLPFPLDEPFHLLRGLPFLSLFLSLGHPVPFTLSGSLAVCGQHHPTPNSGSMIVMSSHPRLLSTHYISLSSCSFNIL